VANTKVVSNKLTGKTVIPINPDKIIIKEARKGDGVKSVYKVTKEGYGSIEYLARVLTKEQTADAIGVSRSTFTRMCDRDEKLMTHYKKGKALQIQSMASQLINIGMEGNVAALIFYLKTQAGWSEQDTVKHHHTGDFGLVVHKISDEDIFNKQDPKLIEAESIDIGN
jgi:hypothetical protein